MPEGNEYYEEGGGEEQPGAGIQVDLIKSYLNFAVRAVRARWLLASAAFLVGLMLSVSLAIWLPRTYTCRTVLMAVGNPILDGPNAPNPLAGASSLISRRENLEALVRDTDLIDKVPARRTGVLKLKDKVMTALFGQLDRTTQMDILVGTVESKLDVDTDQSGNLAISATWGDPNTAAELAEAAREGFVKTRHTAEISAFETKMSILDEHATKLRSEVETLAQQINAAEEDRADLADKKATASATGAAPAARRFVARPAASAGPGLDAALDGGLTVADQKEKLAEMKRKLTELDADRDRRIREEQAKIDDLKLRLTPAHPQVVTEQERLAMLQQVPSDVALLRSEVADLEGNIKQREALASHTAAGTPTAGGGSALGGGGTAAPLPTEIVRALQADKTDPALAAQLSSAVVRYGQLRDEIRGGRMELDTAQAAFNHRYQVMVPAEVPQRPTKPKPAVILGGGFFAALLLAVLLPMLFQLRNGMIIERWQVQALRLPVLAELHLPPHSD